MEMEMEIEIEIEIEIKRHFIKILFSLISLLYLFTLILLKNNIIEAIQR